MKGFRINATAFVLAVALLLTGTGVNAKAVETAGKSSVESTTKKITILEGANVYIDNVPYLPKDTKGNVVEPFIYKGTTYLPARAISEIFGASIKWDKKTNSVYIGEKGEMGLNLDPKLEDGPMKEKKVTATTDVKIYISVDGEFTRFIPTDSKGKEVPVMIIKGTTYLPARAMAKIFDTKISWDSKKSRVYIGEKYVVENPEQYTALQLEALPKIDTIERQTETYKKIIDGETGYRSRYPYILELLIGLEDLVEKAPTEEHKKKLAEITEIYEAIKFELSLKKFISAAFSTPEIVKSDEIFGTLDDVKMTYIDYYLHGQNSCVSLSAKNYRFIQAENLLKYVSYIDKESKKLGIDIEWYYCSRLDGFEELMNSK